MRHNLDEKISDLKSLLGASDDMWYEFTPPSLLKEVPTKTTYNYTPVRNIEESDAELERRSRRNSP